MRGQSHISANIKGGPIVVDSSYETRWTFHFRSLVIASRTTEGYGADTSERATDLARYMLSLAPESAWRVRYRTGNSGARDEKVVNEFVPTSGAEELAQYLIGAFESQRTTKFPLMQFRIEGYGRLVYSPNGDVQVDLKIPEDRNNSTVEIVRGWWDTAERLWPLTRAYTFSLAQDVIGRYVERRNLHDELKFETAIAIRLGIERGLPGTEGYKPTPRNLLRVGWMNRIEIADLVDPDALAPGITWNPDVDGEGGTYGYLQLGAAPEDFSSEMADSVQRALGNPSIDELQERVDALRHQNSQYKAQQRGSGKES